MQNTYQIINTIVKHTLKMLNLKYTNVEINLLKKIEKNKVSIKSLRTFLKKENVDFEKKELKESLIKKVRYYLENNYLKTIEKVNSNNLNMIAVELC